MEAALRMISESFDVPVPADHVLPSARGRICDAARKAITVAVCTVQIRLVLRQGLSDSGAEAWAQARMCGHRSDSQLAPVSCAIRGLCSGQRQSMSSTITRSLMDVSTHTKWRQCRRLIFSEQDEDAYIQVLGRSPPLSRPSGPAAAMFSRPLAKKQTPKTLKAQWVCSARPSQSRWTWPSKRCCTKHHVRWCRIASTKRQSSHKRRHGRLATSTTRR